MRTCRILPCDFQFLNIINEKITNIINIYINKNGRRAKERGKYRERGYVVG